MEFDLPGAESLAEHPSLQERIYQLLRTAIIERRLQPGQPLVESKLAATLGISRNPIREAVRRLQQEGLVEARPRGGASVAAYSVEEADDLYRIRAALEGVAAALAAERITDAELDELAASLERARELLARRESEAVVREGDQFHRLVHQAARNRRLTALLEQLYAHTVVFRHLTMHLPGRADEAVRGHTEILEALRARDAARAEQLTRKHVEGALVLLNAHLAASRQTEAVVGDSAQARGPGHAAQAGDGARASRTRDARL